MVVSPCSLDQGYCFSPAFISERADKGRRKQWQLLSVLFDILFSLYVLLYIVAFCCCLSGSLKKAVWHISVPKERGVVERQKGDRLTYEK